MTDPSIVQALKDYAAAPASPLEGALLVSRIIDPETDTDWCRAQLSELAAALPAQADAQAVAATLGQQGFSGSKAYYKSENSALSHVLSTREGIPISLAMVCLGVCEAAGIDAAGINFPSHFLVSVGGELLDPFSMELVDREGCEKWLRENSLDVTAAFNEASPVETTLRMLNNLSGLARAAEDPARALEITDYKLALMPELFTLYLERVELWLLLGVTDMARRDMLKTINLTTDPALKAQLTDRLTELSEKPPHLH